ncbi:MAG: WG repeat-containing protein, partial [Clostridia bacterium]|nr:WG repeat-containing protein [Clostridia bacterium]
RVWEFQEGLALVQEPDHQLYGYINTDGDVVVEPKWAYASSFSEGIASVFNEEDQSFLINKDGDIILSTERWIGSVSQGYAIIMDVEQYTYGIMDREGNVLVEPIWSSDFVEINEYGLMDVWRDGRIGFINTNGEIVVPLKGMDENRVFFSEGVTFLEEERGYWKCYDPQGNVVFDIFCEYIKPFSDGLAAVITYDNDVGSLIGYIDHSGAYVLQPSTRYTSVGIPSFSEGLLRFQEDGKYGFLNERGEVAIALQWDKVDGFIDGLALVWLNDEIGYIDTEGNVVSGIKLK